MSQHAKSVQTFVIQTTSKFCKKETRCAKWSFRFDASWWNCFERAEDLSKGRWQSSRGIKAWKLSFNLGLNFVWGRKSISTCFWFGAEEILQFFTSGLLALRFFCLRRRLWVFRIRGCFFPKQFHVKVFGSFNQLGTGRIFEWRLIQIVTGQVAQKTGNTRETPLS